jgi:hypothetical protein
LQTSTPTILLDDSSQTNAIHAAFAIHFNVSPEIEVCMPTPENSIEKKLAELLKELPVIPPDPLRLTRSVDKPIAYVETVSTKDGFSYLVYKSADGEIIAEQG